MATPTVPRIAFAADAEPWVVEAIAAGGGQPVGIDDAPEGLVWMDMASDRLAELRRLIDAHPGIRWVQLPVAGVEAAFEAGVVDGRRRWTSAKGAYAEPVAEHALALVLAGLRHLTERARATSWGEPKGTTLFDQPVTIVGGGGITEAMLRLLAPFRVEATVVREHPVPLPGARSTVSADALVGSLRSATAVVLALALTPRSRGLIGQQELAAMRRDAWLVNVGRGALVDTPALVEALRDRRIGGAALDVTDPEPLPPDHPLWQLDNCLVTPHTADTPDMVRPLLAGRISENVRRFGASEDLVGLVDPEAGY